jgi:hypothetical protein
MPKIYLCSFATDDFKNAQEVLNTSALLVGQVDHVVDWNPEKIKPFIDLNKNLFYDKSGNKTRGFGFWSWQPLITLKTMEMADDGDIIIYMDSAINIIHSLEPLIKLCIEKETLLFYLGEHTQKDYRNKVWCKKDTYNVMKFDSEKDFIQLTASVQMYVKNSKNNSLLQELFNYCLLSKAIADSSHCGQDLKEEEYFKDHRHNQSILSILAEKHSICRIRDCSQYGQVDKDDYMFPQIIDHHRSRLEGLPKISVITPTIGNEHLERCIKSVQNQLTPNIEHIIVIDGPEFYDRAMNIIDKFKNKRKIHVFKLPYNVGANGWNGHKIYGAIPHFCKSDLISYLDDDNWIEQKHYHNLLTKLVQENSDVVHCLRTIYDQNGKNEITKDNCESLGVFHHSILNKEDIFVDTSCYLMKRDVAIRVAHLWNKPFRPPRQSEPDRDVAQAILKNFKCSGISKYTVNYPVANTNKSVQSNFFIEGNKIMKKMLNINDDELFPWSKQ